jgi:hypothetical protein
MDNNFSSNGEIFFKKPNPEKTIQILEDCMQRILLIIYSINEFFSVGSMTNYSIV